MAEILRNLPLSEYHGPFSSWASHSRLRDFVEHGPRYFQERHILGTIAREETAALRLGQAFENLWQRGGDYFKETVAVMPPQFKDGKTKAAQEWKAGQVRAGKIVISDDDYQHLLKMAESLETCDKGLALCRGAEQQVTLRGSVYGLKMQARPDYLHLHDFGAHAVDLKTTKDFSDVYPYGYAVSRFGYHTQAAIMRHLLAQNGYEDATTYLLVVEKKPTYRRACIEFLPRDLERAEEYLREWCPKLAECIANDTWPNGPDEVVTLRSPRWVRSDDDNGNGDDGGERGAA